MVERLGNTTYIYIEVVSYVLLMQVRMISSKLSNLVRHFGRDLWTPTCSSPRGRTSVHLFCQLSQLRNAVLFGEFTKPDSNSRNAHGIRALPSKKAMLTGLTIVVNLL